MRVVALFLMLLGLVVFSVGFSTGCGQSGSNRASDESVEQVDPAETGGDEVLLGADGKALPLTDEGAAAPADADAAPK